MFGLRFGKISVIAGWGQIGLGGEPRRGAGRPGGLHWSPWDRMVVWTSEQRPVCGFHQGGRIWQDLGPTSQGAEGVVVQNPDWAGEHRPHAGLRWVQVRRKSIQILESGIVNCWNEVAQNRRPPVTRTGGCLPPNYLKWRKTSLHLNWIFSTS